MVQIPVSPSSKFIALRLPTALIALIFFISCSKKSQEPQPADCLFLSKTGTQESTSPSLNTKNTLSTQINLTSENQLVSTITLYSSELTDPATSVSVRKTTESTKFDLTYDSGGFLIKMIKRKSCLFEGSDKGIYLFENYKFRNFRQEDVETSEYKYESGHVASSTIYRLTTFLGDNKTLPVVESNESKVYQYDGNGKPLSATTTTSSGSTLTTFKNGVIASVIQKNLNGAVTSESKCNEAGQIVSTVSSQSVFEMTYDSRGNLTRVHGTANGQTIYTVELSYDDHKNPENDIPKIFKGIPEPILTTQSTGSVNNLVSEKTTNFPSNQVFNIRTTYTYNSAGLPESSTNVVVGVEGSEYKTTFQYKCP